MTLATKISRKDRVARVGIGRKGGVDLLPKWFPEKA
jgi:hypothetical protein